MTRCSLLSFESFTFLALFPGLICFGDFALDFSLLSGFRGRFFFYQTR